MPWQGMEGKGKSYTKSAEAEAQRTKKGKRCREVGLAAVFPGGEFFEGGDV